MNSTILEVIKRGNFVVLDTETTGLERPAEICQIAVINPDGVALLDTYVHTRNPIPADATRIHGITNEMVAHSPAWPSIRADLLEIIAGKDVIVYNATYDRKLMHWSDEEYGQEHIDYKASATWHCAMTAYAEFWGDWNEYRHSYRWQSLSKAMQQQRLFVLDDVHTALADCKMTLQLIYHCCKALEGTRNEANS